MTETTFFYVVMKLVQCYFLLLCFFPPLVVVGVSVCRGIPHARLRVRHCHFHVLSCTAGTLGFPAAVINLRWWRPGPLGEGGSQGGSCGVQGSGCPAAIPSFRARCLAQTASPVKPSRRWVRRGVKAMLKQTVCCNGFTAHRCCAAAGCYSRPGSSLLQEQTELARGPLSARLGVCDQC